MLDTPAAEPANDGPLMERPVATHVAEPMLKKAKSVALKKPASSDKLPSGWSERRVQRKTGASAGVWDTYYDAPWGKTYRSLAEVRAALEEK